MFFRHSYPVHWGASAWGTSGLSWRRTHQTSDFHSFVPQDTLQSRTVRREVIHPHEILRRSNREISVTAREVQWQNVSRWIAFSHAVLHIQLDFRQPGSCCSSTKISYYNTFFFPKTLVTLAHDALTCSRSCFLLTLLHRHSLGWQTSAKSIFISLTFFYINMLKNRQERHQTQWVNLQDKSVVLTLELPTLNQLSHFGGGGAGPHDLAGSYPLYLNKKGTEGKWSVRHSQQQENLVCIALNKNKIKLGCHLVISCMCPVKQIRWSSH